MPLNKETKLVVSISVFFEYTSYANRNETSNNMLRDTINCEYKKKKKKRNNEKYSFISI